MTVHEQFAEGLALYAMGSLPEGEERLALEAHLEACGACRRELAQLRGDMGLLSVSTLGPAPPERSRGRSDGRDCKRAAPGFARAQLTATALVVGGGSVGGGGSGRDRRWRAVE